MAARALTTMEVSVSIGNPAAVIGHIQVDPKRTLMPANGTPSSFVLQVSPGVIGNARVNVPVEMISPTDRGRLPGEIARSFTR